MSRLVLIGLSGVLVVASSASAGIVLDDKSDFDGAEFTLIDFETRGDGSPFGVEPGRWIPLPNDEYANSGVLISVSPDGSGDQRATLGNLTSLPLFLAALQAAGSTDHSISDRFFDGFVRFDFQVPVNAVGMSVINRLDSKPLSIAAYDSNDQLIVSAEFAGELIDGVLLGEDFGADVDLSFGFLGVADTSTEFAYVVLTEDIGYLDDLHFGIVPEPTTVLLLLGGIIPAVLRRRRETHHLLVVGVATLAFSSAAMGGTISGSVKGYATPFGSSFLPDNPTTNPPVIMEVAGVKVYLVEDESVFTFTDENGLFTLEYSGASFPVQVTSRLVGAFDDVVNIAAAENAKPFPETIAVASLPASGLVLTFNTPDPVNGFQGAEGTTAEVNSLMHATRVN